MATRTPMSARAWRVWSVSGSVPITALSTSSSWSCCGCSPLSVSASCTSSTRLRSRSCRLALAVGLGRVKGHVRGPHELRGFAVGDGSLDHTDAGGDFELVSAQLQRLSHRGEDFLGECDQLTRTGRARHEHDKLVSAEAA